MKSAALLMACFHLLTVDGICDQEFFVLQEVFGPGDNDNDHDGRGKSYAALSSATPGASDAGSSHSHEAVVGDNGAGVRNNIDYRYANHVVISES